MWSSTIAAVPVGIAFGSFQAALLTLLVGTALTCVLVLPPWPMYNRHNLTFLPAAESDGDEKAQDEKKEGDETKKTAKGKKKDEKKSQ